MPAQTAITVDANGTAALTGEACACVCTANHPGQSLCRLVTDEGTAACRPCRVGTAYALATVPAANGGDDEDDLDYPTSDEEGGWW
jgi:hypothetical protein